MDMPEPVTRLGRRDLLRLAEEIRVDLDSIDAAGAGVAAAMRMHTMDPDGAHAMLHLLGEALKTKVDALVLALGER